MTVEVVALAAQLGHVDARQQRGEQMQVFLRRVAETAEVDQRVGGQAQAAFFTRFAQCRVERELIGIDATFGQVPVVLAGHMAQQNFALGIEDDDAATESPGAKELHALIVR